MQALSRRRSVSYVSQPYPATYGRFRLAEALLATGAPRTDAAAVLQTAHAGSRALGAQPLVDEIEALARRARLTLSTVCEGVPSPAAPEPWREIGLTDR